MKLKSKKILSIITISCLLLQTMTMDVKKAFANEISDQNVTSVEEKVTEEATEYPSETKETFDDSKDTLETGTNEAEEKDGEPAKDEVKIEKVNKETAEKVNKETTENSNEETTENSNEETIEKLKMFRMAIPEETKNYKIDTKVLRNGYRGIIKVNLDLSKNPDPLKKESININIPVFTDEIKDRELLQYKSFTDKKVILVSDIPENFELRKFSDDYTITNTKEISPTKLSFKLYFSYEDLESENLDLQIEINGKKATETIDLNNFDILPDKGQILNSSGRLILNNKEYTAHMPENYYLDIVNSYENEEPLIVYPGMEYEYQFNLKSGKTPIMNLAIDNLLEAPIALPCRYSLDNPPKGYQEARDLYKNSWRGILALEKGKPDVDLVIKEGNDNVDKYVLKYRNPYKDPTTEDDRDRDGSNIYNLGRDYLNSYSPFTDNSQQNNQGGDKLPYEEYLYARGEGTSDYSSCDKKSPEVSEILWEIDDYSYYSDFYDYNTEKHINRIYVNYGKFKSDYIKDPDTGRYIYNNESLLEDIKNLDLTLNVKKIAPKAIDNNGIYTDKGRDNTGKFVKNSILYSYFDPDDYATCGFALVYPKIQLKDIYLEIKQQYIHQVSKKKTNLSIDLENKTDKIGYENVVITEDITGAKINGEITAQDSNGNPVSITVNTINDGKISLTIPKVEKSQKIKIDIPVVLKQAPSKITSTAKVESMDGYKSDDLLNYREKLKDYEAKIDAKRAYNELMNAIDADDYGTIEDIIKNAEKYGFSPKADMDKEIEDLRNQLVSTKLDVKAPSSYTVRYEIIDTGFGMPEIISSKSEVEVHKLNEKVTVKDIYTVKGIHQEETYTDKDGNMRRWLFFGWSTDRYKIENNAKAFEITEDTPYETVFYGTWKYIPIKDLKINTVWKDVDGKEIKNHPKDKEINLKLKKNDMSTDKKITLNKQNNWKSSFNELDVTKEPGGEENEYTIEVAGLNENSNIAIDDIEYKPDIKYDEKDKYNATLILTRVTPYLSVNYKILGEKPDKAQEAPIDEKRYENQELVSLKEYDKNIIDTTSSEGEKLRWYFEGWSTDENDFSKENIIDNSFNIVKNTVLYGRWTAVKDINVQIEWRDVDGSKKLDKIPNDKDLEIVLYKNSQTTNNKITANDKNGWKVTFIEQKLEDKDNEYSAKITGQDENEITIDDIKYSIENKKDNGNITIILTRVTPYLSVNYKILGEKPDKAQEAPQDERRYENQELVSLKEYDKNIIDTTSSEGEKLRWYFEGWSTDENDFSEKNIIKDNFKIEKDTILYGRWQKIKLKDIKVSKIWKYNGEDLPKEKYENKSVNIQLYRNGEKVGEEKTLNKENNWTAIYKSQMEAEKAGEKPYEYTVKEIGQDQQGSIVIENVLYKVDSQMQELKEEPDKEKITIQNTRTTPLYKVKYEIIEDPRYKSPNYDFNLPTDSKSYEAGEEVKISDRIPVTQDDKNSNGEYVHWYFVGWSTDKNFTKKIDKINIEKDTTIYGTWRYSKQKDIRVKKEWQDNDGGVLDNKYYEEIEVELYKNNEPTGDKRKLNAKNNWSEKFVKQLDTDENGKLNEYTVKEIGQDENDNIKLGNITYKVITKNENYNIKLINKRLTPFYTLSYKVIEKPEFGQPETVENMPKDLQKLNEGENITLSDIPTTKITTNKDGEKVIWKFIGWTTDKEKFDPSKKITQIKIKDNETVYGTWEYIKLNDIKVSKVWKDQDGEFLREQLYKDKNIIIELYKNDENTGKTIKLNSENGWSDTFKDLPEIDETSGKENIYKVKEKGTNNDKVEIDSIEYKVNITETEKEYTVENIRLTPYLSLNYEIVDSGFGQPETIENMPDKITKLIKGDKVEVLQTPQTKDKIDKNGQKVNWQFVGWSTDKEKFDDENIINEIDIQDNTTVYGTWKYIPLNNIKVKVIWKDIDKKTDLQNEKYPKDAVLELKLQKNGKEVEKQTRTVNDEKGWKEEFTGQPERESIDSEENDYTVKITGEKDGEITVNDIKYKVNITKDGNNITIENVRITPYLRLDYETVDTGFGQPEEKTIQNMPKSVTGLDKNDKVKIEKPLPQTSQKKDDKGNYVNWQFAGWSKDKDNFKAENIIKDSLIITENTKVYGTWQFVKLNNLKVKTIWKDTDGTEFKDDKYYKGSRLKVELYKNSKPTGITNILEQKNSWMNVFDMLKGTEKPGGDKNDYTVSVFGLDKENHIAINNKIFEAKVEKDPKDENTIIVNMQRITPYYRLNYELVKDSQTPSQYSQLPDSHTKLDSGDKVQIEGPLTTTANTNQEGQKVYWHFVGWSKDKNDFSKENIIEKELTIKDNTTVYGKWEQIPKIDIKVKKIRTDKNGKILPEKFYKDNISEVELYKNSKPTGIVRKLSKDNNWNGEFDDILQKDIDSADINKFTVKESGIDKNGEITINGIKYKSETKEESPNNFLIINKRITPFYKVNFEIIADENYGIPKNITGMPNEIQMLEKDDEVSLRQIPQTTDQIDKNGKKANWYFVGWSKDKEKFDDENIVKDIKIKDNTTIYGTWRYIGYQDVKVTTIWKDDTGEKLDGKYVKDENIEVELYKNGEPTGKTEILNDKNNWTDIFTELAQKDSKEKDENNYTIKVKRTDKNGQIELGNIKYQVKIEKEKDTNTFIIENTRISSYYSLRYEIVEDKNYGLPQNITELPENIEKIDSGEKLSLRQIPQTIDKTDKNGKKVNWYFVGWSKDKEKFGDENIVKDIQIKDNTTVYGTWRYIGYQDVKVKTIWKDNTGEKLDGKYVKDENIEVELYKNGEPTGKTEILNDKNNWTDVFTGLVKKDSENVNENNYTIKVKGADDKGNIKINNEDYKLQIDKDHTQYTLIITKLADLPKEPKPETPNESESTITTGGGGGGGSGTTPSNNNKGSDDKGRGGNEGRDRNEDNKNDKVNDTDKPGTETVKTPTKEEKTDENKTTEETPDENKTTEETNENPEPEAEENNTQQETPTTVETPENAVDANEVLGKQDTETEKFILKDTPKTGTLEIKDRAPESEIKVSREPANGKVEVDPDGKWKYTPNRGFTGRDQFTVKYINNDGEEVEELITLDVEEPPRSAPTINPPQIEQTQSSAPSKRPTGLPKTGNKNSDIEITGVLLVLAALILKEKKKQKK